MFSFRHSSQRSLQMSSLNAYFEEHFGGHDDHGDGQWKRMLKMSLAAPLFPPNRCYVFSSRQNERSEQMCPSFDLKFGDFEWLLIDIWYTVGLFIPLGARGIHSLSNRAHNKVLQGKHEFLLNTPETLFEGLNGVFE